MQNLMVQKWLLCRGTAIVRVASFTLFSLWLCAGSVANAQTNQPTLDQFSPNPLEITTSDPLLPTPPKKGENLDPEQSQELAAALDRLNLEALAKLQAADAPGAFEIWNRELRLRRYLGPVAEVEALNRVGKIAWENSQNLQLQFITQRLQAIQKEVLSQSTVNVELLQGLALAFQQVRAKGPAVEVYQQILEAARSREDIPAEAQTLKAIAQLHANWFNYEKAAAVYEELAALIQNHRDLFVVNPGVPNRTTVQSGNGAAAVPVAPPTEEESLKQLAYMYEQSRKPLLAIAAREKLTSLYLSQQNLKAVPPLKMDIASNYEVLGQLNLANQYYQEAYASALVVQQFAVASEALEKMAKLYRSQKQWDAALKIYQVQLTVEQQSYNLYGVMETYDQIGQVYMELKAYSKALAAYQRGLEVAKQLNHKQEYFARKIQKLNQRLKN
ncbi:tetratricopeptide repeat protein [Kamptonema sp. UHCC 0994]|uniref:tetratricopeptide repeat protein n=1 Tax=Kamptonema sp. UHCC 0994 TaxID=3031329 RepID=UPI0023BA7A04|nr:tetratricopeptide repeat protein [Kamptonema sp. UHCC 0994]MDF0556791.1 tetratricopeptide repeat protein [Kamptonema sp. UHCC 0994]